MLLNHKAPHQIFTKDNRTVDLVTDTHIYNTPRFEPDAKLVPYTKSAPRLALYNNYGNYPNAKVAVFAWIQHTPELKAAYLAQTATQFKDYLRTLTDQLTAYGAKCNGTIEPKTLVLQEDDLDFWWTYFFTPFCLSYGKEYIPVSDFIKLFPKFIATLWPVPTRTAFLHLYSMDYILALHSFNIPKLHKQLTHALIERLKDPSYAHDHYGHESAYHYYHQKIQLNSLLETLETVLLWDKSISNEYWPNWPECIMNEMEFNAYKRLSKHELFAFLSIFPEAATLSHEIP